MPHKHKRAKTAASAKSEEFDLPPKYVANPLPVLLTKQASRNATGPKSRHVGQNATDGASPNRKLKSRRSKESERHDDTPRGFARLMALKQTGRGAVNSLDNGDARASGNKKRKRSTTQNTLDSPTLPSERTVVTTASVPKILPGERLADFGARVNQALPVAGLARKAKHVDGVKERQTKHEKKLQKMVNSWKEVEARRLEKMDGERDMADEEEQEEKVLWEDRTTELSKSRKGRRKGADVDDPWAELVDKRDKPKGLHDVVQAPPQLSYTAKDPFKASIKVANVPHASGSLKRREELGETRLGLIERYREMMREQRAT